MYEMDYKSSKVGLIILIVAIILLAGCLLYGVVKSACDKVEAQQTIQSDNPAYTVID